MKVGQKIYIVQFSKKIILSSHLSDKITRIINYIINANYQQRHMISLKFGRLSSINITQAYQIYIMSDQDLSKWTLLNIPINLLIHVFFYFA